MLPAIVDGVVGHRRRGQARHEFRHRVYQWLVDLDALPRPPWYLRPVARFDARDHLGGTGPDASRDIKANVERFLAQRGVDLGAGARIVMLANARVFGHVFDPLTVFWCFASDGPVRCIVAEVHNTFGERHAYLLTPDEDGQRQHREAVLRFAVQRCVRGLRDAVHAHRPARRRDDRAAPRRADRVRRQLHRHTHAGDLHAIARFALRRPAMTQRVTVLIRLHALRLWWRGLPIVNRPYHVRQEGV